MGHRIVLFGTTTEQVSQIADLARRLGVIVVATVETNTVWNRQSSIVDFHQGRHPNKTKPRHVKLMETQLRQIGATTFDDLQHLPLGAVWEVLATQGSGSLFSRTLEGMREVGACFSDWDLVPWTPLTPDWLPMRALNILSDHGVDDLAILIRLGDRHLAALRPLGEGEYRDAVVALRDEVRGPDI